MKKIILKPLVILYTSCQAQPLSFNPMELILNKFCPGVHIQNNKAMLSQYNL